MKDKFVFYAVFVMLFFKDSTGCFTNNYVVNHTLKTDSEFYNKCCCTDSSYTRNDLNWLDPYGRIIGLRPGPDSNVFIEEQSDCLSLYIRHVSKTLAGAYKCITTFNGVQHSQIHNLDIFDPLLFYDTDPTQYLVHGKDDLIKCQALGDTLPLMNWYIGKDRQHEIFNSAKYQIIPQGLTVKNVSNSDGGIYKCAASVITTAESSERDIEIKIVAPPVITQITASPEAVVTANESLIIQCIVESLPEPQFEWKKISDTNPGENIDVRWNHVINNTIRFDNIQPDDAGTYECIAYNNYGESKKQIKIVVLTHPEIIRFDDMVEVEGTEIAFYCNVTGVPFPNVTITYEGKTLDEISESEYDEIIPNYSVLKIDRSSEGFYTCSISNDVGTRNETIYLTVLHKPYFNRTYENVWAWTGETVNISCAHDSNPPANITWRYISGNYSTIEKQEYDNIVLDYETSLNHTFPFTEQFAPYGQHICRAENKYGQATKLYNIRKGFLPSPILNVTTIALTATSATFSIEPPTAYEGPDLIGFIAVYDEADNYEITDIHPNRTWAISIPYKLEKLRPNTTYLITFAAINGVGAGEWSEMIEFDTMDKSAPEPPVWKVDLVETSSHKVLRWEAPENNGVPIDYYALRYCPMDDEADESLCKVYKIEGNTELEVSDLRENTTYYLELIAHNTEGNSSSVNISITVPGVEPTSAPLLSGGVLIGISVLVVVICILLLDILFFVWKKQGIIATCFYKKNKKRKPNPLNTRDKKGLLKDNKESGTDETLKRPNNGHKEYEYNKTTGIITGKHSSV